MTTNIWQNIAGTTSTSLTIGKNGVTIYTGNTSPNAPFGNDGDLFLLQSSEPNILQKVGGLWLNSSSPEKVFARLQLPFGQSVAVPPTTNYIGVVNPPLPGTDPATVATTVSLPNGAPDGSCATVKDEGGGAGTWQIAVNCADGSEIDGQPAMYITNDYGALRLTAFGGKWFATSGF